jgi:glucokinase-like ROK family protein
MGKKYKQILSIDLGGSKLMAGIIDYRGSVLVQKKVYLKLKATEEYLVENIFMMIEELLNQIEDIYIESVAVAAPGVTDSENGVLVYAPYSGIRNFEIGKILSERFQVPVFVENDANACAYGEMIFGACKEVRNFLWITVSNGVGGAIVINGKVYEGIFKGAGEIGHINVVEDGYICGCGNKGCLEAYSSGPAIVRRYLEKVSNFNGQLTAKTIAEAAKKGEKIAQEIYRETGYFLGKAISYAVNLLNLEKVILGGGISMDLELFLPEIHRVINKMVFKDVNKNLAVEKTALLYNAALIGAAAIAKLKTEGF